MSQKINHKHVIIRAETKFAPEHNEYDKDFLNKSLSQLIEDIGMKVVLEPRAAWVGSENNEGWTGQAGLETSHVAYHIWNSPEPGLISEESNCLFQLDLYTCGCMSHEQIQKVVEWVDFWSIVEIDIITIDRATGLNIDEDIMIRDYSNKKHIRDYFNDEKGL